MRDRAVVAALAALLVGAALTGCGTQAPAVQASPSASAPAAAARAAGMQDPVGASPSAAALVPRRVLIPAIGVDAGLLDLRRGADGVLAAPPPGELEKAGWYARGTVPGQVGPAVIAGHVDWVDRPAVFERLGELRPGDRVAVEMSDGSRVRFRVDRTTTVEKDRFPTRTVYGPTPDPQLRLITCGGPWDDARDIYSENVIVSASERA